MMMMMMKLINSLSSTVLNKTSRETENARPVGQSANARKGHVTTVFAGWAPAPSHKLRQSALDFELQLL